MSITGKQLISEVESLAKQAGDKYDYGGTTPATGFDCSGLIYDALKNLGDANPPRTSEEQYAASAKVSKDQLQPGDLVFAQFPGDNASPGHVGIYIGGGKVYSAQDPQLGIGTSTLASWGSNIVGYGRIDNISTTADTTSAQTAGLFSWPSDITGFFGDAKTGIDALMWLVNPASWIRIGSFFIGAVLLVLAIYMFMRASAGESAIPSTIPVPIPI